MFNWLHDLFLTRQRAFSELERLRPDARRIYGYFTDPSQTDPVFDPGLTVPCPICAEVLTFEDIRTISLMVPDDDRSYFYRLHRSCHEPLSETDRCKVDGLLIDAIYSARSVN